MSGLIYESMLSLKNNRQSAFAVLIDPDKIESVQQLMDTVDRAVQAGVDYFFVGGSLVLSDKMDTVIQQIKSNCTIPVVLFPGNPSQVSNFADALLYLSLISGRNAEYLIGHHVLSAPKVKKSGLEIIPTGYMVVDGGAQTSVSYISNAMPLPANKDDIAVCTAIAGELLGLKMMYMDAGSGARNPVSLSMIQAVATNIDAPLIVGGGITAPQNAYDNCLAGANVIVVGNAIEKDLSLIKEMSSAVHEVISTVSKR